MSGSTSSPNLVSRPVTFSPTRSGTAKITFAPSWPVYWPCRYTLLMELIIRGGPLRPGRVEADPAPRPGHPFPRGTWLLHLGPFERLLRDGTVRACQECGAHRY